MRKLTHSTRYLVPLALLGFAGGVFGGPVSQMLAVSPFAAIAMPEPSFPLEFGLTAAGFAGLLLWLRKRKTGPSQNR
jgi:hypothetical protein